MRNLLCIILISAFIVGCSTGQLGGWGSGTQQTRAQHMLAIGIDDYEDGRYAEATKGIQGALDMGLNPTDQVKAYKHLAFVQCVSGKERLCREAFRKALEINPNLDLTPAEAGHPTWGPVFRSLKSKKPEPKK